MVFWTAGTFHRLDVESRAVTAIPVHVRSEREIREAVRFPVEVSPDTVEIRMPRWARPSPDGRRVVFQALGHLWLKDLPDGEARRLTDRQDRFELYPAWSRDGESLVYVTWHDDELGRVVVRDLESGAERILTPRPGHYVEPEFSPDGARVVYRKITGGYLVSGLWSLDPGLYVVEAAGGEPRRFAKSGSMPHFGADPQEVYLVDYGDSGLVLHRHDLESRETVELGRASGATELRVSPDGRHVAFIEDYDVWVTPLAKSGRSLSWSSGNASLPMRQVSARAGEFLAWSGDGSEGGGTLSWTLGPTLYRRSLAETFALGEEAPEPESDGLDIGFAVPTPRPEGWIALVGAQVITMRNASNEAREVIERGVVLVRGDRIAEVGAEGEVEIPAGARVFELDGKTVVPGFIDVHAHGSHAFEEITPQFNRVQLSNLAFGVTTIHDPSNDTSEIFAAAEMQRAGKILAPRIFSTGTILYGAKGPGFHAEIESMEDARFHIRRMKDVGAVSVKSYQHPRRDQRQQLVAAGREAGIMVVPEGGMKFQHNMTEIVDGHTGIEHSLTLKHAYDDVLQLWSATEVGYTPTLGVAFGGMEGERIFYDRDEVWNNERLLRYTPRSLVEPRARRRQTAPTEDYNHIHVASTCKDLMRRGVSVQVGAHGQREGLATHWEMWMFEQGGFTPWEALRSATLSGAEYLGFDGDVGSIEKGKLADLVVIDGDPLKDLRRTEFIDYTMLGGRLYDVRDMSQVAPQEVPGPRLYFHEEGGDMIHPSAAARAEAHGTCRH